MARDYPWYEIVEGQDLEQGDLLSSVPILLPDPELSFPLQENATVVRATFDVVVMTQSCDLLNQKLADIVVCPHWDLKDISDPTKKMSDPALASKNAREEIRKARRPRYRLLRASDLDDFPMGVRIVDFGRVYSLPKSYVLQFLDTQPRRLRLLPPYREYLSQAFAQFFMRVGLPTDIVLP